MRRSDYALLVLSCCGLLICCLALLRQFAASGEAVRLRNSFLYETAPLTAFAWTPQTAPADFRWETSDPPAFFADAVAKVPFEHGRTSLDRAIAIARHLTTRKADGIATQSDSATAYRAIVERAHGYCSDYTQVFLVLAQAAGIKAREWGFGLDGFGPGHAFVEIYDEVAGRWVFLDVFNSFYIRRADTSEPISVLDLHGALSSPATPPTLEVIPISSGGFPFKSGAHALAYYRRGIDQIYLWMANDVLTYEAHSLVAGMGRISRALEQLSAIVLGVHPRILIAVTPTNENWIERLVQVRRQFLALTGLAAIFALQAAIVMFRMRASTRRTNVLSRAGR
jgi:hypothetical protein